VLTGFPFKIRLNYINNIWEKTPSKPWISKDFDHVTFQKNLDFDYHIDITDLLANKSIIPGLSQ